MKEVLERLLQQVEFHIDEYADFNHPPTAEITGVIARFQGLANDISDYLNDGLWQPGKIWDRKLQKYVDG